LKFYPLNSYKNSGCTMYLRTVLIFGVQVVQSIVINNRLLTI